MYTGSPEIGLINAMMSLKYYSKVFVFPDSASETDLYGTIKEFFFFSK